MRSTPRLLLSLLLCTSSACALAASGPPIYNMTVIGPQPQPYISTTLNGLNNHGDTVGSIFTGGVGKRDFLYVDGAMHDIATPYGQGSGWTEGIAVNDARVVAGNWRAGNGAAWVPFVSVNGVARTLPTLGGFSTAVAAINNSGDVAGRSFLPNGEEHAFLYSNGGISDLGTLGGGKFSQASDVNESGQVVGRSYTAANDRYHAFLYSQGVLTDIGSLGGPAAEATAINNAGDIVGFSDDAWHTSHAFIYSKGVMTDLGTRGYGSRADDINDAGYVVGTFSDDKAHGGAGFVWIGGTLYNLNNYLDPSLSGWYISQANDINDRGQILAHACLGDRNHCEDVRLDPIAGSDTAPLPPPVPEPATWAMLLAGSGLIGSLARRKRGAQG
jgi:probable HAF family extracellular repeat protein